MSDDRPAVMSIEQTMLEELRAIHAECVRLAGKSTAPDVTPDTSERDNTTGTKE